MAQTRTTDGPNLILPYSPTTCTQFPVRIGLCIGERVLRGTDNKRVRLTSRFGALLLRKRLRAIHATHSGISGEHSKPLTD